MFTEVCQGKSNLSFFSRKLLFSLGFLITVFAFFTSSAHSQITSQYFTQQPNQNAMGNSSVFRQEIARMEITVTRPGKQPLSLTQVPRVQKNDVIKLRLLDEPVNGIKISQSQWDWTLLVAFINPLHRMVNSDEGEEGEELSGTVSEEIQFRKRGWYRQYSFVVPYDSQPIFFLYPKPKYRGQIVKLVNSKYEEIRKLGEKTIELANAYSKINTFVNEMQFVLNRNAQMLGYTYNNNQQNGTYNPYGSTYNPYGSTYNPYGSTTYNPYGTTAGTTTNNKNNIPLFGLPTVPALNQLVEGLAKSFNIQLPSCWGNGLNYNGSSGYNSGYNSYGSGSGYNPYGTTYNSGSSAYGLGYGNNSAVMDFINRSQCVAKSVNLQDFDISITKMWQQGGVFLAAELQRKYPQLAYYINIAAVAIDFIVKVFRKSPLRIVPTIIQSNDPQGGFNNNDSVAGNFGNQFTNSYSNNTTNTTSQNPNQNPVRISLYADSQPNESEFTTAYPVVVHKWEANPDPEVISLYPPVLSESCLHTGINILKSTDLNSQWSEDIYSRDFRLVMSSANGFKKEFPLRKNMGLGGWELNISPEDMNQIPKINMALESEITGTRGFNTIKSPKFKLPISIGGTYEITPESQKIFSVGGRRTVILRNSLGSCRCLQRVIYKPSFGGQFVYENTTDQNSPNSLNYSADGTEVSFDIDTTNFQPGTGVLEIKTYGGDTQQVQMGQSAASPSSNNLTIKLYPAPPVISEVKAGRGDREILIKGQRLEQLQSVSINGKRASIKNADIFTGRETGAQPNTIPVQIGSQTPSQLPVQWGGVPNQVNTPANSQTPNSAVMAQPQIAGPEQRIAVFEDANARINSKTIVLELHLEDNRNLHYPNQFMVGIARPTLQANNQNEIEGIFLNQSLLNSESDHSSEISPSKGKNKSQWTDGNVSQINLGNYPIVLINKSALTVAVQNILTDYSFKIENLSVETRIENATTNPNELPSVRFDVLDGNNLRLNFALNPTVNKNMSGRRLQFRIIDRERGYSDWYSIKQTFVRTPQIESVICTSAMNNQCELRGRGLDYIAQISIDGGKTWTPPTANGVIHVQPTEDGKTMMRVPLFSNQKLLQIKLRDYPNTEGLTVSNFRFSNMVRGGEKN